ncbi:DNA polymerase III subunit delta' [Spirulina major CS-329]|uniref:DNA polymerase III subunit delta' n=1 Tax=Spirulina TaxID=1154 RepID=UPI00232AD5E9|nr:MULTISPECIES: DNA polymerase III subunit delta' [Spirulina]MDB9493442.1 DNA polymerase III subunit delta' [Spirulina subsalsa CS-330]MDB9504730.1 DNA polymerase III subunit delta' [Spirulina major CS-329]
MLEPFAELVGQGAAVELLERAIACDRIAPAYLFAGPAGVGRRRAAQGFATLLLSHHRPPERALAIERKVREQNHPDFLWVSPTYQHQGKLLSPAEAAAAGVKRKTPPQIRIEQIREITHFLARPPLEASRSVVVIEAAHTMAEGPANALLKTLEEPGQATLILIAPSPENLLATLVSRCQRIPFYRLSRADLTEVLRRQAQADIDDLIADEALLAIAQGSPGAALLAWEQRQTLAPELLTLIQHPPTTAKTALLRAKTLASDLEPETQLWLLDYWQQEHWQQHHDPEPLTAFEATRRALLGYGQPRLAWECLMIALLPPGETPA